MMRNWTGLDLLMAITIIMLLLATWALWAAFGPV